MTLEYAFTEEIANELGLARELVQTLFDLGLQARDTEIPFNSNGFVGTMSILLDKLTLVTKNMQVLSENQNS